jgi:hypothetical protein
VGAVLDCVSAQILSPANVRGCVDELNEFLTEDHPALEAQLEPAKRELHGVERPLERLIDAMERVGWSPSLEQRLAESERDKATVVANIAGVESRLDQGAMRVLDKELGALTADLRRALEIGPPEEARELLRGSMHEVVAIRRRATISSVPALGLGHGYAQCPQGGTAYILYG